MAQLGDKQYNYNFYGLPDRDRVWGTVGVGGYAALTYLNLWGDWMGIPISEFATDGIYWQHDGTQSDTFGKPLDDTVALYHISKNASYATNAMFTVDRSTTINARYTVNNNVNDVPLACCAVDNHEGSSGYFSRKPWDRYADDISTPCNGSYSAMIYDIVYNNFCLAPQVYVYNRSTNVQTILYLDSIASTIGNRDYIDLMFIRPTVYKAATTPRTNDAEYIPQQGQHTTYLGVAVFDTLTYKPIPDNETGLKNIIADIAGGHNYDSTKVYNPFSTQYQQVISNSQGTGSVSFQHQIGFTRTLTKTNIVNGISTIATGERFTGQFYRCNYGIKSFSDVEYQWENVIFDTVNLIELQNGANISSYNNNDTFRFYTRLRIIDRKNNSYGKALELAVKHELAYIGLYFTDNATLAAEAELGTGDGVGVYLPLYAGGVPTGEYVTGLDILDQPHATAGSIADSTFNYDPDETPGGEDTGDFRTRINSGAISAGTIYYAVSDTEFKDLVRYLNTTYNPDEADLAADFKGVNPFDYLTSVKYYPFPLPYAVAQQINVGPLATGVTGYIMPYTYGNAAYSYFDFGSYTFTPRFKNFLDYSATQIQLFLPWCGVVNLDPTIWIAPPGYNPITLKIRYSFDYVTGSVTAFIFRDNGNGEFLIDTADGSAGVDVPLSLFATGSYQQQIAQAQIAYKQAATSRFATWAGVVGGLLGAGVSAAFGNPLGVVGGIGAAGGGLLKLKQAELQTDAVSYTLDHTQPQLGSVSAASPFNAAVMDQRPFILITRPRMQSTLPNTWETTYAHTVGYACTVPASLSDPRVRGFTIIQSPRLEGIKKSIGLATYTPTEQELALIRQHMAAGIIL